MAFDPIATYFRRFVALRPEEFIELRLMRYGQVEQLWVKPDQIPTENLKEADNNGWNVYAGVNPRRKNRGTKSAVTSVVAYHVDL
jgi:hypothetical protein